MQNLIAPLVMSFGLPLVQGAFSLLTAWPVLLGGGVAAGRYWPQISGFLAQRDINVTNLGSDLDVWYQQARRISSEEYEDLASAIPESTLSAKMPNNDLSAAAWINSKFSKISVEPSVVDEFQCARLRLNDIHSRLKEQDIFSVLEASTEQEADYFIKHFSQFLTTRQLFACAKYITPETLRSRSDVAILAMATAPSEQPDRLREALQQLVTPCPDSTNAVTVCPAANASYAQRFKMGAWQVGHTVSRNLPGKERVTATGVPLSLCLLSTLAGFPIPAFVFGACAVGKSGVVGAVSQGVSRIRNRKRLLPARQDGSAFLFDPSANTDGLLRSETGDWLWWLADHLSSGVELKHAKRNLRLLRGQPENALQDDVSSDERFKRTVKKVLSEPSEAIVEEVDEDNQPIDVWPTRLVNFFQNMVRARAMNAPRFAILLQCVIDQDSISSVSKSNLAKQLPKLLKRFTLAELLCIVDNDTPMPEEPHGRVVLNAICELMSDKACHWLSLAGDAPKDTQNKDTQNVGRLLAEKVGGKPIVNGPVGLRRLMCQGVLTKATLEKLWAYDEVHDGHDAETALLPKRVLEQARALTEGTIPESKDVSESITAWMANSDVLGIPFTGKAASDEDETEVAERRANAVKLAAEGNLPEDASARIFVDPQTASIVAEELASRITIKPPRPQVVIGMLKPKAKIPVEALVLKDPKRRVVKAPTTARPAHTLSDNSDQLARMREQVATQEASVKEAWSALELAKADSELLESEIQGFKSTIHEKQQSILNLEGEKRNLEAQLAATRKLHARLASPNSADILKLESLLDASVAEQQVLLEELRTSKKAVHKPDPVSNLEAARISLVGVQAKFRASVETCRALRSKLEGFDPAERRRVKVQKTSLTSLQEAFTQCDRRLGVLRGELEETERLLTWFTSKGSPQNEPKVAQAQEAHTQSQELLQYTQQRVTELESAQEAYQANHDLLAAWAQYDTKVDEAERKFQREKIASDKEQTAEYTARCAPINAANALSQPHREYTEIVTRVNLVAAAQKDGIETLSRQERFEAMQVRNYESDLLKLVDALNSDDEAIRKNAATDRRVRAACLLIAGDVTQKALEDPRVCLSFICDAAQAATREQLISLVLNNKVPALTAEKLMAHYLMGRVHPDVVKVCPSHDIILKNDDLPLPDGGPLPPAIKSYSSAALVKTIGNCVAQANASGDWAVVDAMMAHALWGEKADDTITNSMLAAFLLNEDLAARSGHVKLPETLSEIQLDKLLRIVYSDKPLPVGLRQQLLEKYIVNPVTEFDESQAETYFKEPARVSLKNIVGRNDSHTTELMLYPTLKIATSPECTAFDEIFLRSSKETRTHYLQLVKDHTLLVPSTRTRCLNALNSSASSTTPYHDDEIRTDVVGVTVTDEYLSTVFGLTEAKDIKDEDSKFFASWMRGDFIPSHDSAGKPSDASNTFTPCPEGRQPNAEQIKAGTKYLGSNKNKRQQGEFVVAAVLARGDGCRNGVQRVTPEAAIASGTLDWAQASYLAPALLCDSRPAAANVPIARKLQRVLGTTLRISSESEDDDENKKMKAKFRGADSALMLERSNNGRDRRVKGKINGIEYTLIYHEGGGVSGEANPKNLREAQAVLSVFIKYNLFASYQLGEGGLEIENRFISEWREKNSKEYDDFVNNAVEEWVKAELADVKFTDDAAGKAERADREKPLRAFAKGANWSLVTDKKDDTLRNRGYSSAVTGLLSPTQLLRRSKQYQDLRTLSDKWEEAVGKLDPDTNTDEASEKFWMDDNKKHLIEVQKLLYGTPTPEGKPSGGLTDQHPNDFNTFKSKRQHEAFLTDFDRIVKASQSGANPPATGTWRDKLPAAFRQFTG